MSEATQPLFDDPWSLQEYAARQTLNVGDNWKIRSISTGIHPSLENQLTELGNRLDLADDQKWQEIDLTSSVLAWLPNGWILVVMYNEENPSEEKAGFVNVSEHQLPAFHAPMGNA